MTRVLIAGYQHETNTFAPSLADWAAFTRGDSFPAFVRGRAMQDGLGGINIPVAGFMSSARQRGWSLVPSCWAGAIPSSYVTRDAFERIAGAICDDVLAARDTGGLDAIYLDLHGAAVAEHADDSEGELLARLRRIVGAELPIVASLDLHANVTRRMLDTADALVSYRTYPHVDMAATGELAAGLLARRLAAGRKEPMRYCRLPFLIPLNAQSTWTEPAKSLYEELASLDRELGTVLSFCMGFPAADFDECAPMVWGHGAQAERAVERLSARVGDPAQWQLETVAAREAVAQALTVGRGCGRPGRHRRHPGQSRAPVAAQQHHRHAARAARARRGPAFPRSGCHRPAVRRRRRARPAHAAGIGAEIDLALGTAVPTFTGQLSDRRCRAASRCSHSATAPCTLTGPMMRGLTGAPGAERLPGDRRHPHRGGRRQEAVARPRAAAHGRHPCRSDAPDRRQELEPLPRRLPADRQPRLGRQGPGPDGRRPGRPALEEAAGIDPPDALAAPRVEAKALLSARVELWGAVSRSP
jgi:microcystin degradation protein MlrC